jgi:protein arginine kinase activator
MKCDKCGKNEAELTVRAIINGKQNDFHLCRECFREYSDEATSSFDGAFKSVDANNFDWKKLVEKMIPSLEDIIDGYYEYKYNKNNYGFDYMASMSQSACPVCGNLENNIRAGIFGCLACYNFDSKNTRKLLKTKNNFQGQYQGKYPKKHRDFKEVAIQIRNLQEKLQQSVETEDFEQAKSIKDEIDKLNMKVRN